MPAEYGNLPFAEAIEFFRRKLNMPTARWQDVYAAAHEEMFMVAGAMKADMLVDFKAAIDKAISDGTTLADFQKDFDRIVERYGWEYVGGRAWRTRVIFETNVRQAYNAGRYEQMQDPDVKRLRPYKIYRHSDASREPRTEHLAWDGLVLPADDPWWRTHTPQNGWGCKCKVFTLSKRDLAKMDKSGPDTAPEIKTVPYTDPKTGETRQVPEGIDPGFEYAPGAKKFELDPEEYPEGLRKHLDTDSTD